MTSMNIRRAQENDAPALARVHVDSWRAAYRGIVPDSFLQGFTYRRREERFRQSLRTNFEETYAIEEDGVIIGFVTLGICRDDDVDPARTGEIWGVYISPVHWRKGVGRHLADYAQAELKSRGYEEATLWVLDENSDARRFYEALGFAPDGATKEVNLGEPLKAVRYRKRLKAAEQGAGTSLPPQSWGGPRGGGKGTASQVILARPNPFPNG